MSQTILEPGQLEPPAGSFPILRLPARGLFAGRARRLRERAAGHSLEPFLRFAARLADWQEDLWDKLEPDPLPDERMLAQCRDAGMPPLAFGGWWPIASWPAIPWQTMADALTDAVPDPSALVRLADASPQWRESQARALLASDAEGLDLAVTPFIGAALQTCWAAAAARLQPDDLPGADKRQLGLCPVCGSGPLASVLRIGGREDGLRYLHCGLCTSEWHVVRTKCSLCDNGRGLTYFSLTDPDADDSEPSRAALQAECCPECKGYLKICRLERDHLGDPWADDLATLALDLLVEKEGYERAGLNFLLLQRG
jgi:FdhE protein